MLSQMLWQPTCSARRSGSQHAQPDALAANMFSQTLWQPLSMARRSGSQQAQPDALAATDARPDALAAGHATGGTQMLYRHAHGQLSAFCRQLPVCEVQPLALPTKHEVEPHACKLGLGSSSGAEVKVYSNVYVAYAHLFGRVYCTVLAAPRSLVSVCFAWWTMITISTTVHSTMNTRLHLGSCSGSSVYFTA